MATRLHFYGTCKNEECASHSDKSLGNFYGDPMHDIRVEDGRQISKCTVCEQEFYFRDPDCKTRIKYPCVNASTGEYFKSREEEKSFAKKHKLEAVN